MCWRSSQGLGCVLLPLGSVLSAATSMGIRPSAQGIAP